MMFIISELCSNYKNTSIYLFDLKSQLYTACIGLVSRFDDAILTQERQQSSTCKRKSASGYSL